MSTSSIQILVLNGTQGGIKIYNRPIDWSGEIITSPRSLVKDVRSYVPDSTNGVSCCICLAAGPLIAILAEERKEVESV